MVGLRVLEGRYTFVRDSMFCQSGFIAVLLSDQRSFSFVLCGTGGEILRYFGGVDVA